MGEALDGKSIYGKYEDTNVLPLLDACSAHFGATPDSTSEQIYHYHVQEAPPFVVGCFGPNDDDSLVTVAQCREFYTGCGDGDEQTFTTAEGTFQYDMWCPCYDKNGRNFGAIEELAVFSSNTDTDNTNAGNTDTDNTNAGNTNSGDSKRPNVLFFMPSVKFKHTLPSYR